MNIYLLDIPTDDGWRQQREARRQREAQEIKTLETVRTELQQAVNAKRQAIEQLEGEVYRREALLKKFAPKEYKKYQKKLEELGLASNTTSADENTINLTSSAVAGTTASVGVNDMSQPASETTSSSVGSFIMICTALFLCGTSALFYGKKANR